MQGADLVAIWIAQIGKVESGRAALAPAGRIFDGLAAVGDTSIVEGFHLFRAVSGEPYGAAIGMGGRVPVNRLADSEGAGRGAIEDPALGIDLALRHPDGA